jgi:deoxyxylulose-5-phosphate synthase
MILHLLNKYGMKAYFEGLGIDDRYRFAVGSREELLEDAGLDEAHIVAKIQHLLSKT